MTTENYWKARAKATEAAVSQLNLNKITTEAQKLKKGSVHLHDIPAHIFFSLGEDELEKSGALLGLVEAVQNQLDKISKETYSVAGGTYGGTKRGVILIKK